MKSITKKVAAFACAVCVLSSAAAAYRPVITEALAVTSISSYAYDWRAAWINVTSKSDDTVLSPDISLAGTVNKEGTIKLMINGSSAGSTKVAANGSFSFKGVLRPGRNDVNLIFTDGSGVTTRKTFNYVYLQSYDIVVDKNGSDSSGKPVFTSVRNAINAAAPGQVVFVKNGDYNERVVVRNSGITVIGQDSQKTRVHYSVASKDVSGMTERNCMLIDSTATDFTLENMTVENSYPYTNQSNEQADALCVLADRAIFSNVRLVGYQDTLLTDSKSSSVITRQYFYKCYITGNVDFIYGRGRSYFEDCDIVGRYSKYKKEGCFTAPRTDSASAYGYVFNNCRFTAENGIGDGTYRLGRPWGAAAAAAFINCYMGPCIASVPYSDMSGNSYKNARFKEYKSFGGGAAINGDRPQIGDGDVSKYTAKNVFSNGVSSAFDYETKMDSMYGGSSSSVPGTQPPSDPGTQSAQYTHNFTASGPAASYFVSQGNVQNDKGTVVYENMSLTDCLKLDSKGSLTFTTSTVNAKLTLVTKAKIDNAEIYVNGSQNSGLTGLSMNGNTRTITLTSPGTYTISKGVGETYIYYVKVEETGASGQPAVTQAPSQSQPPSSNPPSVSEGALFCAPGAKSGAAGTYADPTSVEDAVSRVKAGGVVWLKGGKYSFSKTLMIEESNSGKSGAYKTIAAVPGEEVVFDFSALSVSDSNRGVVMQGSWWHWYGIRIQKAGDNGMLLSGSNNIIEMCVFNNNQDTGLQISRYNSSYGFEKWPANNYIKNCTSMNNCDDATMENADGFAAKLTCGNGNLFDGCMAYCNSDDGWDLYAKEATGPIGVVSFKNCIAFRNGFTEDGRGYGDCDGNGFKLGGGGVGTAHVVDNCIAFENFHCGFTDNNNPLLGSVSNCTAYKNAADSKANFMVYRCTQTNTTFKNLLSYTGGNSKCSNDKFVGTISNSVIYNGGSYYKVGGATKIENNAPGSKTNAPTDNDFVSVKAPAMGSDFHKIWRNKDGSINTQGFLEVKSSSGLNGMGASVAAFSNQKATPLPSYSTSTPQETTVTTTTPAPVTTTVTTTPAPVTTTPAPEVPVICGEITGDGVVDLTDLTYLSQYLLKAITFDEAQTKAADINKDGTINLTDLARLRQFLSKKISEL